MASLKHLAMVQSICSLLDYLMMLQSAHQSANRPLNFQWTFGFGLTYLSDLRCNCRGRLRFSSLPLASSEMLSPLLCGEAKKCAGTERSLMRHIMNNPDVGGQNWSKLTVYPGIKQLQPPAKIKGNIWKLHLDLKKRGKILKHIPTQQQNHVAYI